MSTGPMRELAFEEVSLFNAAFLALVIRGAAKGHQSYGQHRGLPIALTYLVVPLALHKPTREALPRTASAQMAEWTQGHPLVMEGVSQRVRAMRPLVSSGVTFGLRRHVLVAASGVLEPDKLRKRPPGFSFTDDVEACLKQAGFLGRWMARQPDALTALAIWGMRP